MKKNNVWFGVFGTSLVEEGHDVVEVFVNVVLELLLDFLLFVKGKGGEVGWDIERRDDSRLDNFEDDIVASKGNCFGDGRDIGFSNVWLFFVRPNDRRKPNPKTNPKKKNKKEEKA